MDELRGRVGFAVGTGRCGTQFLSTVVASEPGVASSHERHIQNEAFHRYCQWYGLPVDHAGFAHLKKEEIAADLSDRRFSFEASAQLSASIETLYHHFRAKFLLVTRSPERVVNSFVRKGLYRDPVIIEDPQRAPGYQPIAPIHRFLGRITPTGAALEDWNRMTQVGRIAWYWNAVNEHVLDQFGRIAPDHWRIERLESLTWDRYKDLARFFGFVSQVSETEFRRIAASRPNSLDQVPTIANWSPLEKEEFQIQVHPMARLLGYEYEVAKLPVPAPRRPAASVPAAHVRLRGLVEGLKRWLG